MSHIYRRRKVKPKINPNWVTASYEVWFMALGPPPFDLGNYPKVRSVTKDPIPFNPYKVIKPGPFTP